MDDDMPPQRGVVYDLKQHQQGALKSLREMRENGNSIAMLYEATGTGKTVTAVSDAKAYGKRVLFLAHTKELVYQAYEKFREIWPEVSVGRFVEFYEDRIKAVKIPEKKPCLFTRGGYTQKEVEQLILRMPFRRFEDMGFMHHAKALGNIRLDRSIMHRLTDADIQTLKTACRTALRRYFGDEL